jgi:hypothetical protein
LESKKLSYFSMQTNVVDGNVVVPDVVPVEVAVGVAELVSVEVAVLVCVVVVVRVVVIVEVAVVVAVVVGVVLVGVVLALVVGEVVREVVVVGVVLVVGDVVPVLVIDVVGVVVGVVTMHSWKSPALQASDILFSTATVAAHALLFSNNNPPTAHFSTDPAPAGPRNASTAALIAEAVVAQLSGSVTAENPSDVSQTKLPVSAGHPSSTAFNISTCIEHRSASAI